MLRAFVLGLGILLAVVGATLMRVAHGNLPGVQCLALGLLIVVGVVFERWRYRRPESRPPQGSGWQKTGERFVDPESGKSMDVYYDAANGERRYVESGEPAGDTHRQV